MEEESLAEVGMIDRAWSAFFGEKEQPRRSTLYWKNVQIQSRLEEEVVSAVDLWYSYVHPRVRKIFSVQQLDTILFQLARNVNKGQDPVTGTDECVLWHGDITVNEKMELQAAMCIVHKDQTKTVGFTNRLLAFIFADDESYEILQGMPASQDALKMACGNPLCVNLAHVALH